MKKKLIPNNAKLGKGCIKNFERNPTNSLDNTLKNPSDKSLEEKVYEHTIKDLRETIEDLQKLYLNNNFTREKNQKRDLETNFLYECKDATLHLINSINGSDHYWSSNLASNNYKHLCAPFHLVLAIRTLEHDEMKSLTRHWAVCQPKRTLIIAPMHRKTYLKSYWKDWLDTYKLWGGRMDFLDVKIQMMGLDVSVGEVSNIL